MPNILDILNGGFKVYTKTQFGPEVEVYDSKAAPAPPGFAADVFGPVGVQVRDQNGNVVYSFGEWPKTNYFVLAALGLAAAAVAVTLYKGIR